MTIAYDLKGFQVTGGPGWVDSDRWDVTAKLEQTANLPPGKELDRQVRLAFQALLADRFPLATHSESRPAPAASRSRIVKRSFRRDGWWI